MEYLDDDDSIFEGADPPFPVQGENQNQNQNQNQSPSPNQSQIQGGGEGWGIRWGTPEYHPEKACFYVDDEDLSEYDRYVNNADFMKDQEEEEKEIEDIDEDNTTRPKFVLKRAMDDWNAIKERYLKSQEEEMRQAAVLEEARKRIQASELSRGAYHDPGCAPKPYLLECVLGRENCEIRESIRLANEIWLTPARLDYGIPDDFMPREWVVGMRVRKVSEGTQVEFKQGRTSLLQRVMNDIERYGNAFVNTRGGVLIYGVTDDGIVEGVRLNRHDRDFINNGLGERISTLTPKIPPECYRLIFVPTKLPPNTPSAQAALLRAGININERDEEEEEEEEEEGKRNGKSYNENNDDEYDQEDSLLLSDKESYVIIFVMGYHKTLSSRYILFKNNIAVALQRANSSTQFVSIRMISYAPSSNSAVPGSKEYSEVQAEEAEALRRVQTEAEEHEAIMAKRRSVLAFRETLSAYKERDKIGAAISENRVTIIAGPTGCGKSTQVPQIISDAYDQLRPVKILVVQPRRISAVALARRVAEEMGVKVGEEVGYHIGGRPQCDDSTRILFITYGMFKQYFDNKDLISPFTHIVLDEIHERKLDMDLCLAMALSYASKRSRTRVVVMSATIDVGDFSRYCGGFARMQNTITGTHKDLDLSREYVYSGSPWLAKTVRLTGRKFPIQTFYLDDILPREGLAVVEKAFSADRPYFNDVMKRTAVAVIEAIASKILSSPNAALSRLAILVFLPGISAVKKKKKIIIIIIITVFI